MSRKQLCRIACAAAFALVLGSAPSVALEINSFVSGTGDDNAACTRIAPCRTLNVAITKTEPGGVIVVLDSAAYGPVSIDKSITIRSEGSLALLRRDTGIFINIALDETVALIGLHFQPLSPPDGQFGVRFVGAGKLELRDCQVRGYRNLLGAALKIETSGVSQTYVSNCTFADNRGGVLVKPTGGTAFLFLDNVEIEKNTFGLRAEGGGAKVILNDSTAALNGTDISALAGAKIFSYGNNAIANNPANTDPITLNLR